MDRIIPIQAFTDNYIWCLIKGSECLIVDPGEAAPVIKFLKNNQLTLKAILVTHHHYDHTNGLTELVRNQDIPVYGSSKIPFVTNVVSDQQQIVIPHLDLTFTVFTIPAHTLEHVAYYGEGLVFTGDTLFTGGCGRIFEGTAFMMYQSLYKLSRLPSETLIYCGHEYTVQNLKFARLVEPGNLQIKERLVQSLQLREEGKPTVPATLLVERETNPFLRCDQPAVIDAASRHVNQNLTDPVAVLKVLREWKNSLG